MRLQRAAETGNEARCPAFKHMWLDAASSPLSSPPCTIWRQVEERL